MRSIKVDAFIVMAALTLSSVVAAGVLAALGCEPDAIQVGLVSSIALAILSVGVAVLVRES